MTGSPSIWAVRVIVLGAFVATVCLCGPRAAAVLAAKFGSGGQPGPMVVLDRVGFAERPAWLDQQLLVAVAADLSPWLSHEVGILDEPESRRLRDGLTTVSWVREVRLERVFPDRFRLHLELRRPVLAVRDADDGPLCLVDEHGVMMPFVATTLPTMRLYREGGNSTMAVHHGLRSDDPRVTAAAGIAAEWRESLQPLVAGCPRLVEVDTTNLGERWIRGPEYPEVRVHLARQDGEPVVFGYGRPIDSNLQRVPVATKATVLRNVLGKHPGLTGLVAGDLRFARRWDAYLQPRPAGVPDPNRPWQELLGESGR